MVWSKMMEKGDGIWLLRGQAALHRPDLTFTLVLLMLANKVEFKPNLARMNPK